MNNTQRAEVCHRPMHAAGESAPCCRIAAIAADSLACSAMRAASRAACARVWANSSRHARSMAPHSSMYDRSSSRTSCARPFGACCEPRVPPVDISSTTRIVALARMATRDALPGQRRQRALLQCPAAPSGARRCCSPCHRCRCLTSRLQRPSTSSMSTSMTTTSISTAQNPAQERTVHVLRTDMSHCAPHAQARRKGVAAHALPRLRLR